MAGGAQDDDFFLTSSQWWIVGSYTTPVETKSHGTKVPCPSRTYEFAQKNVMWKDSLFPRQHPTSSPSPSKAK